MDIIHGHDGRPRCFWCGQNEQLTRYHDEEWGRPVADDQALFEKLCLESFQAGLSWRTILAKREAFRAAFAGFDPVKMAAFDADDVARLLENPGIIRHRGKIEAVINNAARFLVFQAEEGYFAGYVWGFEPPEGSVPYNSATSTASIKLAGELKKRGWKFLGPTTIHAFMQAMGMVNDHHPDCMSRSGIDKARAAFIRPERRS